MQNDLSMNQLKDKLSKFTSFDYPENIRSLANDAVSFLNRPDAPLPIPDSESPVVRMLTTIFMNHKLSKSSPDLVSTVFCCISFDIFSGNALETLLKTLTKAAYELDCEAAVSILQKAPSQIIDNFPHLTIIRVILSFVLTMMSHSNDVISSSAFATFPQIIEQLINSITSFKGDDSNYLNFLKGSKFSQISESFENRINFILYLFFNDLTSIALKQPLQWLNVDHQPTNIIYDVLELIINTYHDLIVSEPQISCIFEGAIIQSMSDINALQFIICFVESFLNTHFSLCTSLFDEFLSQINSRGEKSLAALYFFRSIATRQKDFAARFFIKCESDMSHFSDLFKQIQKYTENLEASDHLTYSLNVIRWNRAKSDKFKSKFIKNAPFEIVLGIIESFCSISSKDSSENETNDSINNSLKNIGKFISQNFYNILKINLMAMKFATLETFNLPCKLLFDCLRLMKLTNQNEFNDYFEVVCNLKFGESISQDLHRNFQIGDKIGLYSQFLAKIAEIDPNICSGKWKTILTSLFSSGTNLELDFSQSFEDKEVKSITESSIEIKPLPFLFLANLTNANSTRFDLIWSVLEPFFKNNLETIEAMDSNILSLLIEMIGRCMFESSEVCLMEMAYYYVKHEYIDSESTERILNQIRNVLAENTNAVKNSWVNLFKVLLPSNFDTDSEILHLAFNVLTMICNDHIQNVPQDALEKFIDLIIAYSDCTVDINLSLSSFDLMWNVVRVMGENTQKWKHLMSELLRLIHDTRNDISSCAIRTFFSLMSSNFEQIPNEVIEYFIASGFNEILDGFDIADLKTAPNFELALQELAHYSSSFWTSFDKNKAFHDQFLPQAIEKATNFCVTCKNFEIVTNSFQFFETFFECEYLDAETAELLRKAIEKMADCYLLITDMNNMVFSCYGRLVNRILLTLKTRNTLTTLPLWFPLINRCATTLRSEGYVHITPQRMLDIIPSLFPIGNTQNQQTENPQSTTDTIDTKTMNNTDCKNVNADVVANVEDEESENQYYETSIKTFEFLRDIANSELANDCIPMSELLFDILVRIFNTDLKIDVRLKLISICKDLVLKDKSENLSKLIINAEINPTNELADDIFTCYLNISNKWSQLQATAKAKLVSVLYKAPKESQIEFVKQNQTNITIIKLIWTTYFDPNSETFNEEVLSNSFDIVVDAIAELLSDARHQIQVLAFLKNAKSPKKSFGNSEETTKSHLLRLVNPLTLLITSRKDEVRSAVQKIFEIISRIIATMK
ncbi:hypothetical protein TRFO_10902 [Tritrichomonas foetus]|uniref:Mon2/Sec7/BIG1-like dimerisation and cyclophilin-binding domain-containing protein n=1 Tax=Tritrichomonas foetus TaxID=1144522 RepID=A0A1J4J6B5_9EUKA|nr:hypothetical protein TRFO_10902 [Tritrichomonas foetus]|eukprot:OHS94744.1 hypothetical protein TRFO_10902 [Tritrichomonas foetus]